MGCVDIAGGFSLSFMYSILDVKIQQLFYYFNFRPGTPVSALPFEQLMWKNTKKCTNK